MSEGIIAALIGAAATVVAAWMMTRRGPSSGSTPAPPAGAQVNGGPAGNSPGERESRRKPSRLASGSRGPTPLSASNPEPSRFRGVVRSQGSYADGQDSLYIAVNKADAQGFPYRENERFPVELELAGGVYSAGVRTTPSQTIVYIASDLRGSTGEDVRLASVLESAGLGPRQEVAIEVDGTRLRVRPAATLP